MTNKNFFNVQNDGTAVKIRFYENYIEGYLFKILMSFGNCVIADLFCGPGKNGEKDGSPLILVKKAVQILKDKKLRARQPSPEVIIIFNDHDKTNVNKLNDELSKIDIPSSIKIIKPRSNRFSDIVSEITQFKISIPKFFFLDPFTYSDIQLSEIKGLMEMKLSEIMMFLPTFLAYRFTTSTKNPRKLLNFLTNFTDKGVCDYADIYDFVDSIKRKIRQELDLKFVQHALIDVGKNKNSLFLLTRSIEGAMLFNNLFWKESYGGQALEVSEIKYHERNQSLFSKAALPTAGYGRSIARFQKKMLEKLMEKRQMFNTEIIEFAVAEGYKPKCANDELIKLNKANKIRAEYQVDSKNKGFYVSEDKHDQRLCKIVLL